MAMLPLIQERPSSGLVKDAVAWTEVLDIQKRPAGVLVRVE